MRHPRSRNILILGARVDRSVTFFWQELEPAPAAFDGRKFY